MMNICLMISQGYVAEAMLQKGSFTIGGASRADRWQYLTKFGYGLGDSTYSLKVKVQEGQDDSHVAQLKSRYASLELQLYLDEDWANAEALPACQWSREAPARKT